jgi:hypothetical protein
MKVIGAGFGRTGTLSTRAALEQLGFGPCYHMLEVFDRPEHAKHWAAAVRGEAVDWNELFAGYGSAVDWPACSFYEPLMEAYPDAKVLLTVRDPELWYESTARTIYTMRKARSTSPVTYALLRAFAGRRRPAMDVATELVWVRTFDDRFEDRKHAIEVFERHIDEVKRRVPADRLLVYDVKEGWEPLCRFLGVPVPEDTPFPRLNDAESFQRMMRMNRVRALAIPAAATAVLGVVATIAVRSRRRKT